MSSGSFVAIATATIGFWGGVASHPVRAAQFGFTFKTDSGQLLGSGVLDFNESAFGLTGVGRETASTFGTSGVPLFAYPDDLYFGLNFQSLISPFYNSYNLSFPNKVRDIDFTFDSGRLTGMNFVSDFLIFEDFYSSCCNQVSEKTWISGVGDRWTQTTDGWQSSVDLSQIGNPDYEASYVEYTQVYTGKIEYTTIEPIRSLAIPEPDLLLGGFVGLPLVGWGMLLKKNGKRCKRIRVTSQ